MDETLREGVSGAGRLRRVRRQMDTHAPRSRWTSTSTSSRPLAAASRSASISSLHSGGSFAPDLTESGQNKGPGSSSGLQHVRNGLNRDGSDGTRTRDLRRDRPRRPRRLATTVDHYARNHAGLRPPGGALPAWLRGHILVRLGHEKGTPGRSVLPSVGGVRVRVPVTRMLPLAAWAGLRCVRTTSPKA